jgi:mannose-6-phosphate isomerase-like protein (cupin superfamily)
MNDRITPESARAQLDRAGGQPYVTIFHRGGVELEYYAPQTDAQQPHTRDEIYFVISGHGTFVRDGRRQPFTAGEVLHVPAGVPHRFEEFSADFATWAIFCD